MNNFDMKGKTCLKLIDAKTGRIKQEFEKHNLVTNAVNQILSSPKIPYIWGGTTDIKTHRREVLANFLPVTGGLIGGCLLFNKTLDENENNVEEYDISGSIVGHAGNAYSGDSVYRGTFLTGESGIIKNDKQEAIGYRYVWQFPTICANGIINSVCLTSVMGGNAVTGKEENSLDPYDYTKIDWGYFGCFTYSPAAIDKNGSKTDSYSLGSVCFVLPSEFTYNTCKFLTFKINSDNTVSYYIAGYSSRINDFGIFVLEVPSNKNMNPFNSPPQNLTVTEIWRNNGVSNINAAFWYYNKKTGFFEANYATNSASPAIFTCVQVSPDGHTYNSNLCTFAYDTDKYQLGVAVTATTASFSDSSSSTGIISRGAVLIDGTLITTFIPTGYYSSSNRTFGVYKVDVSTGDVKSVTPVTIKYFSSNTYFSNHTNAFFKQVISNYLFFGGSCYLGGNESGGSLENNNRIGNGYIGTVDKDFVVPYSLGSISGSEYFSYNITSYVPCIDKSPIVLSCTQNSDGIYMQINVKTDYLATINNLSSAVTKTDEDVLKVYYELTFDNGEKN